MLFRQIARAMLIPAATMAMAVLIFLLSTTLTEVTAAERIPDSELAKLYSGWWFYDPYCSQIGARDCPEHTPCDDPLQLCAFCIPKVGKLCRDGSSPIPDRDGCDNGTEPCDNAFPNPERPRQRGYCLYGSCEEDDWPGPPDDYPDCNNLNRHTCDD